MKTNGEVNSARCFGLLARLAMGTDESPGFAEDNFEPITRPACGFKEPQWRELHTLAGMHHVILRALPRLLTLPIAGEYQWIETAVEAEQARIDHALNFLAPICKSLEDAGTVVVIKTLDHWPDFGGDLDLYTDAEASDVVAIMRDRFQAQVAKQSWGDRLANKWNFRVPGLPELVEVHVQRLGQTGEQRLIGQSIVSRSMPVQFGAYCFSVPSPEDRIIVSTLQRIFRHFYLRLCDVLDLSETLEQRGVDYDYLHSLAKITGLWEGVATYLKIVSGVAAGYRGRGIALPPFLSAAARFGSERVRFGNEFLRIPLIPDSARLYVAELKKLFLSGKIRDSLRLGLLPFLATAAAVEYRITGSDKRIW